MSWSRRYGARRPSSRTRKNASPRRSRTSTRRWRLLDRKEDDLSKKEKQIRQPGGLSSTSKIGEYDRILKEERERLEKISGVTAEEAKRMLMQAMEDEARYEGTKTARKIEEEARERADKKAKEILALAIQRYAGEYVAEDAVSVVSLPNEEMKGRIIGREGRNIRALEGATGVDIIIDDTPEAVILSCFNPIRREVARDRHRAAHQRRKDPPCPDRGGRLEGGGGAGREAEVRG